MRGIPKESSVDVEVRRTVVGRRGGPEVAQAFEEDVSNQNSEFLQREREGIGLAAGRDLEVTRGGW